jgi:glycosyltransferase involved in cell wall biosynthesis
LQGPLAKPQLSALGSLQALLGVRRLTLPLASAFTHNLSYFFKGKSVRKDRGNGARHWLNRISRWFDPRLPKDVLLPPRARSIWQERNDLKAAFDISTRSGEVGMLWWYLRHGFSELRLRFDPDGDRLAWGVNRSYPGLVQNGFLPITWLMRVLGDNAPAEYRAASRGAGDADAFLAWFFARGLTNANLEEFLAPEQAAVLRAPDCLYSQAPCLFVCIWKNDAKMRARYTSPEDPAYIAWCQGEGARSYPILSHQLLAFAPKPERRGGRKLPFGVNLLGHLHSRGGVGEDVRAAAEVLKTAGIDYVVRDVYPGDSMGQEEATATGTENDQSPYAITMACMTAEATLLSASELGAAAFTDHHVVGFWPWELPELPHIWRHAYDLVDEIWASSAFTYAALARSSPAPVHLMPMAVIVDGTTGQDRSAFGLPMDRFLFGFAFDGLSTFARKSPYNCIEAFARAFPDGDEPVGLVIKAMRAKDNPQWETLVGLAAADRRIHLVEQSLSRSALLDLWRALDCFVSLHRSEGFGRNIAEAMCLGIPVIATAHSGNMDFTTHETAALVPVRLKMVEAGEYPFAAGQLWAEPDLECAAANMRRMVVDSQWRERISRSGKALIERRYGVEPVAKEWTAMLSNIYAAIDEAGSQRR